MIRPTLRDDLPALRSVIAATDLFPSEMLDDMMAGYFDGTAADDTWLTDAAPSPVALAYCAPERMTAGTWNLFLIAVHPRHQGQGHGAALVRHVEALLRERDAHLLLVETSGLPEFARTRAFYPRCGFTEEARLRDFYKPGDDKVVFRKALQPS